MSKTTNNQDSSIKKHKMKSNLEKLDNTKHMFKWFSKEPYQEMLQIVEEMFKEQVPSAKMLNFSVVSDPQWLSGGKKSDEDDNHVIIVRAGVAFESEFTLKDNNGIYNLKGIFTWVATSLDSESKQRQWMDLDGTLDEFGSNGLLNERIYMEE